MVDPTRPEPTLGDLETASLTEQHVRGPAMWELGDQLAAAERRPALLIHATEDPYVPPEMVFPVAERIGAGS
jgi:hypothetical protein